MTKIHLRVGPYRSKLATRRLREAAKKTLAHEAFAGDGELAIIITSDEEVQALNRRYRGIDAPTDVLSFGQAAAPEPLAPGEPAYLGDVLISYPRARTQAKAAGHATADELVLLVIHGVLHLLGHDHVRRNDKRKMWAAQAVVLREMGARVSLTKA